MLNKICRFNQRGYAVATYLNKSYSKRELSRHIGDMSQIAGVRPVELVNGNERGVRALEFKTGSGFMFTVLADRGLDILDASYNGLPIAWLSPTGAVGPAFYDRHDVGWLWSYGGGLVVTCGLTQVGVADIDEELDEELGLHGRISNTPARNVSLSITISTPPGRKPVWCVASVAIQTKLSARM